MVMALAPIYGITLVDVFGYMIMVPLLPYVAQRYGANGLQVGALLATMAVASVVAAPVWGTLSDRIGRKPMVLFSQIVSLTGYILLATAPSLAMLYVARGVAGIGGGGVGVTQSYIADVTDEAHRDRAYGLFGVVFGIGIVLGPVAGGFLVRFGYFAPFAVAALIEVVNIVLTLRFLPNTHRQNADRTSVIAAARQVLELPDVRLLVARHFLFIFAVTFFFTIFALYVQRALDLGPSQASWLLAGTGIVGGIALVAGVAPLAERYGDTLVAQVGLALNGAAYLALPFARTIPAFAAVLVVWAIGASCIEPTLSALLSERAPEDRRGATMGVNDALSNAALMVAPALGGWIVDKSLALVGVVPAIAVLGAFALGLGRRARPGKQHGATERKKGLALADSVES
jgi:DHA1 family tetracycline resistance protein-like MFS transporter